jgi:hypothetical protein
MKQFPATGWAIGRLSTLHHSWSGHSGRGGGNRIVWCRTQPRSLRLEGFGVVGDASGTANVAG